MFTNFAENALVNSWFRSQAAYKPAAVYIGLLTAVTDAEAGTVTEVTGGSYARQQIAQADAQWSAPATINDGGTDWREITNVNVLTFPTATANWGTITHFGVYDAATGGNLLGVVAFGSSRTINNSDTLSIGAGLLKLRMAGALTNFGRDRVLNGWFRTLAAYKPAAIHLGLLTAVADALAGTVTEVTGGSYGRQAITQADAQWNAPANSSGAQQITNVNAINFPSSGAATANWGNISHFGVYDAGTGGNLLMVSAVDNVRTINSGDTGQVAAGILRIGAQ